MSGMDSVDPLFAIAQTLFVIFLYSAWPVLVFGVPLVMMTGTLPSRLGVQPIKEEELSDPQLRCLAKSTSS